jgi:hypothetical protein
LNAPVYGLNASDGSGSYRASPRGKPSPFQCIVSCQNCVILLKHIFCCCAAADKTGGAGIAGMGVLDDLLAKRHWPDEPTFLVIMRCVIVIVVVGC